MIVDRIGNYRLLEELKTWNAIGTATLPRNTILNIEQIDHEGQKIIGPRLLDWIGWNLPVVAL